MPRAKRWGAGALADIVAAIYAAAAAPDYWIEIVEQISRLIPGEPGGIIVSPLVFGSDPAAIRSLWKEPDGYLAAYDAYFGYRDELAIAHMENRVRDQFSFGSVAELMPRKNFEQSDVYNNLMRGFDLEDTTGLIVSGRQKRFMLFGMYGPKWNARDAAANRRLFDNIRPHFANAIDLHWRLADAEGVAAAGCATLETFRTGILWLDKDDKVLWMNCSAEEMLALRDGLLLSKGTLTAQSTGAAASLSLAIRTAARREAGDTAATVRRPSGRRPFFVNAVPPEMPMAAVGGSKVAAIAFVTDLDTTPNGAGHALGLIYGLSVAETRVAQGLAGGLRPEEIAERHGSSIHTVRVQIKSIMAKMETTRHSDIVRLSLAAASHDRGRKKKV